MIKTKIAGKDDFIELGCEFITFPGGERHVRFTSPMFGRGDYARLMIEWLPKTTDDVMDLLLVKDAINRAWSSVDIELHIQYMPYARQDRVANSGEALSVRVMTDLINNLNFKEVFVYDPHSDVTPALLEPCTVVPQMTCIKQVPTGLYTALTKDNVVIVAPDSGATKKALEVAKETKSGFLQGVKYRNTITGALEGFGVSTDHPSMIEDADLWLVDDICDGGGTFLGLKAAIDKLGIKPRSINLYVTHGIFSKGVDILLEEFDAVVARFDWTIDDD